MNAGNFMLSESFLRKMIEKIKEAAKPQKIILFGSVVRRDMRRSSDIDLAIKGITAREAEKIKGILNEEIDTLKDFDVLSLDDMENDRLKKRILEEGKVIYERNA